MWTADPQALAQLTHIFTGTLLADNNERKLANDALQQAKLEPEFENYLFSLLVLDNAARSDVRAAAGINLKNSILRERDVDRLFLKENVIQGLLVNDSMVRNITGNVITSLFSIYGMDGWPHCLPQLIELTKSNQTANIHTQEAAMSALSKICEDSAHQVDREYNGERPLNYIISTLLTLMDPSSSPKVRATAIHCINQFIPLKSQSILVQLDEFLAKLFQLANDDNNEVRRNICTAFAQILEARSDKIIPHLDGVVNYCLHLMQDTHEDVALEACEFLLALSTSPATETNKQVFQPKLPLILPVLLDKMVYSEEEIFYMEMVDERDNADVADRDEDVKPQAAKSKSAHTASSKRAKQTLFDADSDSEYDDEEDDEDDDDDDVNQWSLRKCSAATLDILSLNFPGDVIQISIPILQEKIVANEWPIREASILAFGAISKSVLELAGDKIPTLIPFLVERLSDNEPRVRQITCWTLSRYAQWVNEEARYGNYSNYFQPTFQAIMNCALDSKKVVQEAACSALSSFIEESDSSLLEVFLAPLLVHFAKCFETYQRRNLVILYDCVQTFVEVMGHDNLAANPQNVETLLTPLLHKWQSLDDNDNSLWPLLECMASVAATLGELFAPYALPVYERASKILAHCIEVEQQCHTDPLIDTPEKDFMVTSLDLIDGLIQGFEGHSADLINGANLMQMLLLCFEDPTDDVRQSAYALLGDLAIFVPEQTVKPCLLSVVVCIGNEINNRSYTSYAVYNNAIWALGEIAVRCTNGELEPYMNNFLDLLIPFINSSDMQQAVLENAAICLGRLGLNGGASKLAPRLVEFIIPWCSHMLYLIDNNEKETCYQGILQAIHENPDQGFGGLSTAQGRKNLSIFITTVAHYFEPPQALKNAIGQTLQSFKAMLGDDIWNNHIMATIDPEMKQSLQQAYSV